MSEAIRTFLKPPSEGGAYTDERLAMLLAHAEDGKLSYYSCCCLRGVPTADHALRGNLQDDNGVSPGPAYHGDRIVATPMYVDADHAFKRSANTDEERRAKLIPMIKDEMARRASLISTQDTCETRDNDDPLRVVVYEPEKVLV